MMYMFGIYKKSYMKRNNLYIIFFGYPKLNNTYNDMYCNADINICTEMVTVY